MNLRSAGMSVLLVGLIVTSVVALRAADDKIKGKPKETKELKDTKDAKDTKKESKEVDDPGIVKFTASPAAVQKTFKDEVKNGKIELLGKGINDKGIVFYKAMVGIGGNDYEVAVGENGMLLEKILQMATSEVEIDDCPAPVLKTLKEEAKGAKVEAVERVAEGKRIHFVIDVTLQKAKYQVIVTEDGTLISKVIDYDKDSNVVPPPMEATGKGKGTSRN